MYLINVSLVKNTYLSDRNAYIGRQIKSAMDPNEPIDVKYHSFS